MARQASAKVAAENGVVSGTNGATLQNRLSELIKELDALFLERTDLIKLMLTAYLAKGNLYIGGKPGTGKTLLAKTIASAFGTRCFYYLVSATTQPDELLGAVDLGALQQGKFERDLTNSLADTELAILDEIFKASSPVLNSLLGIILDHEIVNGKNIHQCPLNTLVGCSNELPDDESLAPFWDRFVLRYWVEDISLSNTKLLLMRTAGLKPTPAITINFMQSELALMQREALALPITESAVNSVIDLSKRLKGEGIEISTRKHVQIIPLLQAYAYIEGDLQVTDEHLDVLTHVFWNTLEQREKVSEITKEVVMAPYAAIHKILESAQGIINKLNDCDKGDTTRYKAYLGGADNKFGEMIRELDNVVASNHAGRAKLAGKVKDSIEAWRKHHIINAFAKLEFGV